MKNTDEMTAGEDLVYRAVNQYTISRISAEFRIKLMNAVNKSKLSEGEMLQIKNSPNSSIKLSTAIMLYVYWRLTDEGEVYWDNKYREIVRLEDNLQSYARCDIDDCSFEMKVENLFYGHYGDLLKNMLLPSERELISDAYIKEIVDEILNQHGMKFNWEMYSEIGLAWLLITLISWPDTADEEKWRKRHSMASNKISGYLNPMKYEK